jgi:uncharacterized protein YceK
MMETDVGIKAFGGYSPAMNRRHMIVAFAIPLLCCGCGTLSDMTCGPGGGGPYYRGVRMDAMAIREGHPLTPLLVADVPVSAVADTAMVPYITYEQAKTKKPHVGAQP